MELVPVQCQNCGAQLSIDPGNEQAQCSFCGTKYAVKASGSTIGLRRVTESLVRIDQSTNLTAVELRIARLREERRELEGEIKGLDGELEAIHKQQEDSRSWGITSILLAVVMLVLFLNARSSILLILFLVSAMFVAVMSCTQSTVRG